MSFEDYIISQGWTTRQKGSYSTMGTTVKLYTKYDDISITFGLSEVGKPPTIRSPRPKIKENGGYHSYTSDDFINALMQKNTPEQMLNIIRQKFIEL